MLEHLFLLKRTEIFRSLPEDVLRSLASNLSERHLDAGVTVFERGDVSRAFYLLAEGTVSIHAEGVEFARIEAGEVFGERSALTGQAHSASASTATDCHILTIDRDLIFEAMAGNASMVRDFLSVLLERFQ
jgi:CRP-like cAMP-binding protein